MDMKHLSGPNFISKIQTSPLHINSWVQAQLSLIFTFRTNSYATWDIFVFLQASMQKLIWEAQYSRVAGHFGVEKIVVVLEEHFYWPKLRQDVSMYIRSCTACAIANPTIKKKGLYTPLPVPEKPWESISMD
jgi:hypothetical protein